MTPERRIKVGRGGPGRTEETVGEQKVSGESEEKQRSFGEIRGKRVKSSQVFFLLNKHSKQTNYPVHPFASSVRLKTPEDIWLLALFLVFPRTVCELGL